MFFYRYFLFSVFLVNILYSQISFSAKALDSSKEAALEVNQELMKIQSNLKDPRFEKEITRVYQNYVSKNYPPRKRLESIWEMYMFLNTFTKANLEKEEDLRIKINRFVKMMIQTDPKGFADILLERISARVTKDFPLPLELSFLLLYRSKELQEPVLLSLDQALQNPKYKMYENYSNEIRKYIAATEQGKSYVWDISLY